MKKIRIAVLSFPGNNCEVESVRSIRAAGMEALYFRWNDDRAKLEGIDGYFVPGGFSYEDRGRSGMVAARDPLMEFIGREADLGKPVIGNCNGAQILIESGLVPVGDGLRMSLARNCIEIAGAPVSPGFLSEWVWITPSCAKDRCVTSNWTGAMQMPIAHGEGRFISADPDVIELLKEQNQIAFRYCSEDGTLSSEAPITPNGSTLGIAGICNPRGNVVALMPHPERTDAGLPYFTSLRQWIEAGEHQAPKAKKLKKSSLDPISTLDPVHPQLFIGTLITNNEERTVEQAARRVQPKLRLKQWKYYSAPEEMLMSLLQDLTVFNSNKEEAFVLIDGGVKRWNASDKRLESSDAASFGGAHFLRRDLPDTASQRLGDDASTGVCYGISGVEATSLEESRLREIFCNPHSSVLERVTVA